ncbi:MAG: bifunctional phosphoribosylaminoimidazolecarboxamide formyltransferase/IMP cyclohydrolase [Candidatus Krumholzibacteriia bacterium]
MNATRRALLSVTDKTGLDLLGPALVRHGYQLVASGGTASALAALGLEVTEVSDLTGFPEIFGGRVKTLHPLIHGGILGRDANDFAAVEELGLRPIDVVVVNLYRFAETAASAGDPAAVIEKIDIGGPGLLRAAAKNCARVTALCDPRYYAEFLAELEAGQGVAGAAFRRRMAAAVFAVTANYDRDIRDWFLGEGMALRYGENPHQKAFLRVGSATDPADALAALGVVQHGGKELSFNNIVDLVAAVKLVDDFRDPCCAVIKHTNPCGFGLGAGAAGLERALVCDPVSAFGGVFAFNAPVDEACAEILAQRFLEIVVAPGYAPAALARLTRKKNLRVLTVDPEVFAARTADRRKLWGDLELVQEQDVGFPELDEWKVAAGEEPDPETRRALEMAWKVCKHGKSNAIVLAGNDATLGLGFGQMSRVDSTELAVFKARNQGIDLAGCVAASDGFFPFPDGIEKLAAAGARAVIAPGGSIRDEEVAAAARDLGIIFILTGRRHFNH